jgi:hypothetical protein
VSVKVSSWVWEHSKTGGGDRLLLLAIADCADDDGDNAWPSVSTLAHKTQTADRTVQRGIDRLQREGCLEVHRGAGRGGTHRYRVLMDDRAAGREPAQPVDGPGDSQPESGDNPGEGCQSVTPVRLTEGVTQLRHRGGDTAVSPERPERPITTPPTPAGRGARTKVCRHGAGACRRCGTNPRSLRSNPRAAADAELAQLIDARAAVVHCGAPDCNPATRWREPDGGRTHRCPQCHPDVVVGPAPRAAQPRAPALVGDQPSAPRF